MRNRLKVLLLVFLVLLWPNTGFAAGSWNKVVSDIDSLLQQSLQVYQSGDREKAKELVNEAYFGPFETDRMEQAIRINISAKRAAELEFQFRAVKKQIDSGADSTVIKQETESLMKMLRADAKVLQKDEEDPAGKWFYSFLIIVREGVEAILIVAAIAAYLVKSGNREKVKEVYVSTLTAILASLATAYIFKSVFNLSGEAQELLEGAILAVATIVLLSMSFWMVGKADTKKWKNYIEGKVQDSIGQGKRFALWFAVFLAVYREGAETVLFYQALFAESPDSSGSIWAGFLIGSLLLVVLFFLIRFGSARIPLQPFFLGSGILLYVLAFIFAGDGIKELQAAGFLSGSEVQGLPTIGWLGVYPTWQGILTQMALLILPIAAAARKLVKMEKQTSNLNS